MLRRALVAIAILAAPARALSYDPLSPAFDAVPGISAVDGSGTVSSDIDLAGNYITDSTGVMHFGSTATSSYSLDVGDALFGAKSEFAGAMYRRNNLYTAPNTLSYIGGSGSTWAVWDTASVRNHFGLLLGTEYYRNLVIGDRSCVGQNFDHPLSTNPKAYFHSATCPNTDNTQWIGIGHDQTNAVIGTGNGALAIEDSYGKGATTLVSTKSETVTFAANPGDASKVTTGSIIPDGAFVVGVSTRNLIAATNCTSVDIGIAGTDTDMFADGTAVALGTTTTTADANTAADWSSVKPSVSGDQEITVTAVGGNCFDGSWAITVHYLDVYASAFD